MKKLVLLLLVLLFFSFCACTSAAPAPSGTVQLEGVEGSSVSSAAVQSFIVEGAPKAAGYTKNVYTNQDAGFSFSVPSSWKKDNYTIVVSHDAPLVLQSKDAAQGAQDSGEVLQNVEPAYTEVNFIFQNDKENPLLSLYALSCDMWSAVNKGPGSPEFLMRCSDTVFCFSLPLACPYTEGDRADLYNSMVMERPAVHAAFRLVEAQNSSESVSQK